jgi:hypothetical protein
MLTVFWDFQGVRIANFQKLGENVNSIVLWSSIEA